MGASTGAWHGTRAVPPAASDGLPQHVPLNQPEIMIGGANERLDTVGKLTDEQTGKYVARLVQPRELDAAHRAGSGTIDGRWSMNEEDLQMTDEDSKPCCRELGFSVSDRSTR